MSTNSSNSTGGNGNTNSPLIKVKQSASAKNWFFTFNNYVFEDIAILESKFKIICSKYIFQEEIGKETNTKHLQGCITLKNKMRPTEFNLNKKIHWETTRNLKKAEEYCQKIDTRNGAVYKFGYPKDIKIISQLLPWQQKIEDLLTVEPHNRKIYWIWSKEGGFGKSAFTKYMAVKNGINFVNGGDYNNICNIIFNLKMHENDIKMLIFDLPRASTRISFKALEQIKNGMITNLKYETGMCLFNPPHLIVLSNIAPDYDKLSKDRFIEINLKREDIYCE